MTAADPAAPVAARSKGGLRLVGEAVRPSVVIVDWNVTRTSPIGSSLLTMLAGLHHRYRFVVFAAYFENPSPDTIEHVRVRLPRVPTFMKELCWPAIARVDFTRRRLGRLPGAVTRATQGQLPGADIVSAHFCHRAYLSDYFSKSGTRGLRRISRFIVHRHGAHLERKAFRRARVILVPSQGLAREIERTYPSVGEKIHHLPNPVDTARFACDEQFDRVAARAALGFRPDDVVFAFVALGDFGRKGLAIGLRALAAAAPSDARLLVVGGTRGEIGVFKRIAETAGIADDVHFVGLQQDVRPYLWLSDAFLFPTIYEAASKAVLQAAAAGLPLIAPRINGIEDVIEHGVNGWFAERTAEGFTEAIRTALDSRNALPAMGGHARLAVAGNDIRFYVQHWDDLLTRVLRDDDRGRSA
jgi:glycosyltransferase involved in cell wall biosynthesis